jgi:serine/threonine protein kinase
MGKVYEGLHLRLNKKVAIKVMARQMAANQEALARFHREAEITSRLGHPNLVHVIDFGISASGEPFIVMEYLEGEDLEERLQRTGPQDLSTVIHLTRQIASALAAAHDQDIVHRDLKPANIFLMQVPEEPDFVKVLDFGISKIKTIHTQITNASAIMGTPDYMAPEQANGHVDLIDHRTDQWALGCIVWEMLSGRVPFVADDVYALFYQIINLAPQPLCPRVPNLPLAVERVLRRAIAKNIYDRFDSVRDFFRELENASLETLGALTPTPPLPIAASEILTSPVLRSVKTPHRWRALFFYCVAAFVGGALVLALPKIIRWGSPAPTPTLVLPAPTSSPAMTTKPPPVAPTQPKKSTVRIPVPTIVNQVKAKPTKVRTIVDPKVRTMVDPFETFVGNKHPTPSEIPEEPLPIQDDTQDQGTIIREL